MSRPDLEALPEWPAGTVAILATGGGPPHAIPVSAAIRTGPRTVLLGLARGRESLARLRTDPRCALTLLAGGVAVTAHAGAVVVAESLAAAAGVAAVRLDVARIQDHGQDRFAIDAGVRWHWTDAEAERRDGEVRAALAALGG